MRKIMIITCCLYLVLPYVNAQEFLFLGEGRNNEVRFFWIPKKSWPEGLEGFNIKRKSNNENTWQKLNSSLITPGTELNKSLTNVGLKDAGVERLETKRKSLIAGGSLKEIPNPKLIQFLEDEQILQGISVLLNSDFDIALIAGFGFIDQNIPKAKSYSYGLFPVYSGIEAKAPAGIFQWQYDSEPEINVGMEGSQKAASIKTGEVELVWKVSTDDYKKYDILNGFNVFRKTGDGDYTLLNEKPIWISVKEKSATLYYKDENVDLEKKQIYAAAPHTIFNTNGTYSEIKIEVNEEPENIEPPVLSEPENDQGSLLLNWYFPNIKEPFIKGFYVQKADENDVFINISDLVSPEVRNFKFKTLPPANNKYYHFKIVAVKNDGLELWSNRRIFLNQIVTAPSSPRNLKATIINEEGKRAIHLEWDVPLKHAEEVTEYYLYSSSPNQERVVKEGSLQPITSGSYTFPIYSSRAANYSFAVSATNAQNEESALSEKITITMPSEILPFINIWPVEKENGVVKLSWKYPEDITDLSGFRLYQNKELIADEKVLDAKSRQWVSVPLDPGVYSYEILAVSLSEVSSELSQARKFEIKCEL